MPFGLFNEPSTLTRLMTQVLQHLFGNSVIVYFDDVLVYSHNDEEHLKHLTEILEP